MSLDVSMCVLSFRQDSHTDIGLQIRNNSVKEAAVWWSSAQRQHHWMSTNVSSSCLLNTELTQPWGAAQNRHYLTAQGSSSLWPRMVNKLPLGQQAATGASILFGLMVYLRFKHVLFTIHLLFSSGPLYIVFVVVFFFLSIKQHRVLLQLCWWYSSQLDCGNNRCTTPYAKPINAKY